MKSVVVEMSHHTSINLPFSFQNTFVSFALVKLGGTTKRHFFQSAPFLFRESVRFRRGIRHLTFSPLSFGADSNRRQMHAAIGVCAYVCIYIKAFLIVCSFTNNERPNTSGAYLFP
jgi:hypothetical protein